MTSYKTKEVKLKSGKVLRIPVDSKGHVPESEIIKHFNNQREGVKNGRKRRCNTKDYDKFAEKTLPLKGLTPREIAKWWNCPADGIDIEYVDTPAKPQINTDKVHMTAARKKSQEKIKIIGTPAEETKVRTILNTTYSEKDLERFASGNPLIIVRPLPSSCNGRHFRNSARIDLERNGGNTAGVLAHEGSHYMREFDKTRNDPILKANQKACIEESCTVAEEMARSPDPSDNGYYDKVPVWDKDEQKWRKPTISEARQMAKEDRDLFTYGRNKPLKGNEALESVRKNWPKSHISRLKYKSSTMAISDMAKINPSITPLSIPKEARDIKPQRSTQNKNKRSNKQSTLFTTKPGTKRSTTKKKSTSLGAMIQKRADKMSGKGSRSKKKT